ncbi:hypothetical protein Bca52824_075348 [Brassica carinata]|uniref:Uncharacterized protein n=1 Tax=Brassica carinata TaxID=52824 RepID=A0A8X7PPF5_BRACI|nr:hypothetical protein Bca52824_075348 [Brassica carinata]
MASEKPPDLESSLMGVEGDQAETRGAATQRGLVDLLSRLGAEGKLGVSVEEGTESRVQMVDKGEDSSQGGSKTKEVTAGNQERCKGLRVLIQFLKRVAAQII